MKKILVIAVAVFAISLSAWAASFPDVPEDYRYYPAIEFLDERQIIKGYDDGTFKPDALVNRAEALKIIVGAAAIDTGGEYDILFPDVLKSDWFFPHVMTAHSMGVVVGYKDGKFKPVNTVNLAETLKMLTMTFGTELPVVEADVFADVLAKDWFAPYVLYAREKNLLLPDDDNKISPDQVMTRGALADLVYRMIVVSENNGAAFPLQKDWPYYEGVLPFKMKYDLSEWKIFENRGEVVFLRPDKQFAQFSAARIYPNSGVVRVALDGNEGEQVDGQYFANIKAAFSGWTSREFNLGELKALEAANLNYRATDWYIYLPDKKVLAVYTQYGPGTAGVKLAKITSAMLSSLEYREVAALVSNASEILSQIFAKVLVEGEGMAALDLLPDKLITETDTIGLGAGTVDYYYSSGADYTFKYERNSDTILDTRKGKTTAF